MTISHFSHFHVYGLIANDLPIIEADIPMIGILTPTGGPSLVGDISINGPQGIPEGSSHKPTYTSHQLNMQALRGGMGHNPTYK
jgi:hypothetical protein